MEKRDMDEALRNLEQNKSRWLKAHGRNRALKSLEEHYDQMEKVAAERRVQREIDDRAGTRASNTDPWKA
jgi:flagellar biosynthesis chaperone FliJ